jgi:hypothetical protein
MDLQLRMQSVLITTDIVSSHSIRAMCNLITSLLISENTTIGEFMDWLVGSMVFNTTFNNILVISWRSALLVEETIPVNTL